MFLPRIGLICTVSSVGLWGMKLFLFLIKRLMSGLVCSCLGKGTVIVVMVMIVNIVIFGTIGKGRAWVHRTILESL